MDVDFSHDAEHSRFVVPLPERYATLEYREVNDHTLDFQSTLVYSPYRGKGYGKELVERSLEWARDHDYRIIPTCPFVKSLVDSTDRWDDVLVPATGELPSKGLGKLDPSRSPGEEP